MDGLCKCVYEWPGGVDTKCHRPASGQLLTGKKMCWYHFRQYQQHLISVEKLSREDV